MHYDCFVIDDEEALSEATCEYLNVFGVSSTYVTSYEEALLFLEKNTASVLLLDINLGNQSGFDLCKKIRESKDMPILFISARQSDDDILMALGIGGDDYIKKPYTLSILLAKVKAILKRCSAALPENVLCANNIKIDIATSKTYVLDQLVPLKQMEFKLLLYLMKNKNRTITKDELFEQVWNGGIVSDSTLNVHIRRVREKIEVDPNNPQYIKTIWGVGYVFEVVE